MTASAVDVADGEGLQDLVKVAAQAPPRLSPGLAANPIRQTFGKALRSLHGEEISVAALVLRNTAESGVY